MIALLLFVVRLFLPPCETAIECELEQQGWSHGYRTVCLDAWTGMNAVLDEVCEDMRGTMYRHNIPRHEYPDGCK